MYKGVIAFIGLQLVALFIVGVYPQLVNYLPNRMSLLSDTAPPPLNPRLQYCVEEYVFNQFAVNGNQIKMAITEGKKLDYSMVPKKLARDVKGSFVKAESIDKKLLGIRSTEDILNAEKDVYRPLHREVRALQKRMHKIDGELKKYAITISRMKGRKESTSELEAKGADHKVEREQLEKMIPANWDAANKKYVSLLKADKKARNDYRKAVDGSYTPISELLAAVEGTERLAALRSEIQELAQLLGKEDKKASASLISAVSKRVGAIEGTKNIKKQLSKMRSAIKSKKVNPEKVMKAHASALEELDKELAWREKAVSGLLPGLQKYEAAIRGTIGLRQQPRLPREQALSVASCNSDHRDVSLSF